MKKTTNNQKLWDLLRAGEFQTIATASSSTGIQENSIALYIRALFNTGYIEADTPHTKIQHQHKIILKKNTGPVAPVLNKNSNILTDKNTFEEHVVFPSGKEDIHSKTHKNLIPILKAIVAIGKNEIYRKEISEKMKVESYVIQRWIPRLIESKVLIETGEVYRNSPLLEVDMERAKLLLKFAKKLKSSELAFCKLDAL